MNTLVEKKEQAVSVTDLHRRAKSLLDRLMKGEESRFVIFRKNQPSAVVLSVETFEHMMEEMTDLRVEREAMRRLHKLDRAKSVSHGEMKAMFRD